MDRYRYCRNAEGLKNKVNFEASCYNQEEIRKSSRDGCSERYSETTSKVIWYKMSLREYGRGNYKEKNPV
jgi:hypothetical protein